MSGPQADEPNRHHTDEPNRLHADELNRLHAEVDHLTTVHRTAAGLARSLTEHLADEPFRLAEKLARLLDGELEPDDIPEGGT